jgi:hypothetical protein
VTPYVRYSQLMPETASFSVPDPCPATVFDVVTETVVDAPAASVADVVPEEAKTIAEISGTEESVIVAVCVELETFFTVKTLVNVRADGTVPSASESEFTFPEAIGVLVPTWTADPGVAEKWLEI